MASPSTHCFPILLILISILVLLVSPGHSLACTSQTLSSKKQYSNCVDLPTLKATLHYSYNATNSSLSVAFVAAPEKPDGWVAWAINPTKLSMNGAQSFIALKSNGSLVVKMFNISGYDSILETNKLAFDAWDLSAESEADGKTVIYASVKVPEKAEKVNQVWQVSDGVMYGHPMRHKMAPDNLGAKSELQLVAKEGSAAAPQGAATPHNEGGSGSRVNVGLGFGLALVAAAFVVIG